MFFLGNGNHESRMAGMCAMEALAYLAGEQHGDRPACVSPVIRDFVVHWNDNLSDHDRQTVLRPLLHKMLYTHTTMEDENERELIKASFAVRDHASMTPPEILADLKGTIEAMCDVGMPPIEPNAMEWYHELIEV